MTDKEVQLEADINRFPRFIKRVLLLFVVLIVAFTMIGFSPVGVREINNFFFSLFIREDARIKELEEKALEMETPTVTLTSVKKVAGSVGQTLASKPTTAVYGADNPGEPTRIIIPKIGVDSRILNPDAGDVLTLDAALLSGAVRYPGVGTLTENRTMFLFGHGSNLPVVRNPAFKVFTRLKELQAGDEIVLKDGKTENRYKVRSVSLVNANTDIVQVVEGDRTLVLLTCNTLGKKEDRYMVYADFVGSYSLAN